MENEESQSSVDEDEHDSDASTSSNFLQPESGDTGEEEAFNTDLPAEHTYLGNLERVSGVQYLEPNRYYRLPLLPHDALLFPGETLPMILTQSMFLATQFPEDGLLFGIVFQEVRHKMHYYGVTCQIYEKGNDQGDSVSIKSRAYQRFCIKMENLPEFTFYNQVRYAEILILPEIVLPHPVYGCDSNSLSKFRLNEQMKAKLMRYSSKTMAWPDFVFKLYDVHKVIKKIQDFLATLKIETEPMDLVALSFWYSQNAVLSAEARRAAFITNNVLTRIFLIGKSLDEEKFIICKRCRTKIAPFENLFAMSREGVLTSFCNPGGFIHTTHTITEALPGVVLVNGRLSNEFSWFPGYTWRYVHCSFCSNHLGWMYYSTKSRMVPKTFIGLTGKSINVENIADIESLS